jgi:hypothetical protein
MKLPDIRIACGSCLFCFKPEEIAWSFMHNKWLCSICWEERSVPLIFAKDALPDADDMMQRLIAAAATSRMGVK